MTGHAGQVRAVVTGAGSLEIKWPLNPPTTSRRAFPVGRAGRTHRGGRRGRNSLAPRGAAQKEEEGRISNRIEQFGSFLFKACWSPETCVELKYRWVRFRNSLKEAMSPETLPRKRKTVRFCNLLKDEMSPFKPITLVIIILVTCVKLFKELMFACL